MVQVKDSICFKCVQFLLLGIWTMDPHLKWPQRCMNIKLANVGWIQTEQASLSIDLEVCYLRSVSHLFKKIIIIIFKFLIIKIIILNIILSF
jgi:hypothetical protein